MQKNCEQGESTMMSSFQAGTAVHTSNGLMAIEEIRVGTQVLTQGAAGEAACYRPVTRTVSQLDQPVYVVQIRSEAAKASTLFVTPDTAFQVEDASTRVPRPIAAKALQAGQTLFLAGGRKAQVQAAAQLFHTQHAQYACAAEANAGIDILVDMGERQLRLADASVAQTLGRLAPREPVRVPVYHFEVEGAHSCYVGDVGVGGHNMQCSTEEAVRAATEQAENIGECFVGDTPIRVAPYSGFLGREYRHFNIENIEVGDEVLSRSELTGEVAYKRVTKVVNHGFARTSLVQYSCAHEGFKDLLMGNIETTSSHPFWVDGKGWVKVQDILPGDEFVTDTGDKARCIKVELNFSYGEVYTNLLESKFTFAHIGIQAG